MFKGEFRKDKLSVSSQCPIGVFHLYWTFFIDSVVQSVQVERNDCLFRTNLFTPHPWAISQLIVFPLQPLLLQLPLILGAPLALRLFVNMSLGFQRLSNFRRDGCVRLICWDRWIRKWVIDWFILRPGILKTALLKAVERGQLEQITGKGARGTFQVKVFITLLTHSCIFWHTL